MDLIYKIQKNFIKMKSLFLFNKEKRRKFRNEKLNILNEKVNKEKYNKSIFGVSYSLFDGAELLEASIKSIRSQVDYINVVYQNMSWYGEKSDIDLALFLSGLKKKGLIDEFIEYKPDLNIQAGSNEILKRNLGLEYAKKHRCTYFMTMDCDEFYIESEFENAKKYIVENDITHSYCRIINYGAEPTNRLINSADYAVPFFGKINKNSSLGYNGRIILADPTRQLCHHKNAKYYVLMSINMHHMSFVRKNVERKLANSSTSENRTKKLSEILADEQAIIVENIFNISID